MNLEQIIQVTLFPYALGYLAIVFFLPSYRVYKKTGKNPTFLASRILPTITHVCKCG